MKDCLNMADIWQGEATETQVWLRVAERCNCLQKDKAAILYQTYGEILRTP